MSDSFSYEDGVEKKPAGGKEKAESFSYENAMGRADPKGFGGHLRDTGLSLLKGAISVPEAAVGLADIPAGGRVGKFLENEDGLIGFRPGQAKEFLSQFHTDQYKEQQQEFQEADGILDKAKVAIQNPSLITNTVAESLPGMGGGAVAARGLLASTRLGRMGEGAVTAADRARRSGAGAAAAGAAGEGAFMAGMQASEIRSQTDDGLLTPEQSGYALATGGLGGLFGYAGGRLAQKLGIGDVDTMLARGVTPDQVAADLAGSPAKSIPRQIIEGAIAEGFLEELPQSVSETILQNLALNREWHEGVEDAVVMGTLAGMAMGGVGSGYSGIARRLGQQEEAPEQGDTPQAGPFPALPAPVYEVSPDGTVTTTQDTNAATQAARQAEADRRERIARGDVLDVTTIPQSPSEQMGIDPNAGPLSTGAAIAVDTGVSQQMVEQATLAEAAQVAAQEQKGKGRRAQRPEQPSLALGEQLDPATGEIVALDPAARAAQLQERLGYIQQQARAIGWDKNLVDARNAVEAELAAIQPQAVEGQERAAVEAAKASAPEPAQADDPKRAKALTRINSEKGAFFFSEQKAQAFIDSNGLGNEYTLEQQGRAFKVVPKSENAEPAAQQAAPQIEGRDRGDGWAEFTPESGTLSVPRADMPQIKAEHRGAMVNFLNARGIAHQEDTVPAASLKPTQAEFSRDKVQQAREFTGGNRSILVSADGHVLDGHHQWMAARDAGEDVKVIRLDAPIRDLVQAAHDFPSSTTNQQSAPAPSKGVAPGTRTNTQAEQAKAPFDVTHAAAAAYQDSRSAAVRKAWNDAHTTTDDEGNVVRVRPDHFEAWHDGGGVSGDVGSQYDAHGIAKGNPLGALLNMLRNGVDSSRRFDTAPLTSNKNGGAGIGTATGGAYKDGPFIVLSGRGKTITDNGIETVLVSDPVANVIPALQQEFPRIRFIPYSQAQAELSGEKAAQATAPEAETKAKDADPIRREIEKAKQGKPKPAVPAAEAQADVDPSAGGRRSVSIGRVETGSVLESADGTLYRIDGIDLKANKIRTTRNPNQLSEKVVLIDQDTFDRIARETEEARQSAISAASTTTNDAAPTSAASTGAETKAKDRPKYGESNKLVSQARREEIRALMRKKALNLNSGVDPELMALGAELAVFHIEAGTRKFADFAKAMIEDIGEKFTPFLRSFYDAARSYPGLDTEGMTPYEETIKQHAAMLTPAVREAAAEVVGAVAEKPKKRARKTGARGDMVLTQDWGVEHIDGYGDSPDRETGNDTKDAFLKETRNYLNAVADALRSHGYEPHDDRKGKPEKPVSVNQSGVDGSGDVTLTMRNPDTGNNVYIHVGDTALRGVVPSTASGIAIMYRVGPGTDRYAAKAGNTWAPVDLSANELAALMSNHAQSAVQQEGATNERTEIRGDGPQALADVAAAEGGQPESDRGAGASAADSGQERAAGSSGSDAAGVPAARSGRGGTGSVRNAPARARRQRGAVGEGRGSEAAEAVPQDDARVEVNGEPTSAPNIPAANFQITEETQLGKGGEVQKFNDNLAAIRALKQIEADHRRATPEEQAILARYVGWGGLANAFPDPTTGNFKDRWKDRGEQLRSLLTDDEYKAARRSTRNAHYTSETIVTAMWKAVEKMGFKGGLVLESSMGTGNFVGLAPQNTGAKFVGIEYDSLTARMAQALYPQATVLHSGFQRVPLTDNSFALNIGNPPFGSESLRFQYKPELQGVSIHNQFFRAGMDALRPGGIQSMVVSRFLMDAQDKSTRLALAKQARLVGLIRLPDTAFRENARTEVVTDIVILQKLSPEEQADMAEAVEAYQRGREKDAGKERERQALAARVPAWVETAQIPDPLGGEAMTVNAHFRGNPQDILGTLERSGSMQHGADITVRLDNTADLQGLLDSAIERLPSNIQNLDAEVLAATEDRFKSMSDALRIAVANEEVGHVGIDRDGKLQRVIERETPEGEYEYARQELTADSPWSDQLSMDADGKWYRLVVKTDDDGKPVKVVKDGKTTRLNVYERTTFDNEADIPSSLRLGKTGFERLTGMVGLRDLLKRQLTLETADAAKGVMEANRKALAKAYGEFTKKHGPINRPVNLRLAMTMPDGGLVAALEVGYQPARTAKQAEATGLDVQEEIATPAPIMRERVVPKYEPATRAESPSDALAISLAESGRVNMERIASLLDTTQEEAASQLQAGDSPLVFRDPETQQWETADVYLTGMVKRKLQAAKAAGASQNVAALEKVIPEDWTAENVAVQMGSTWVPPGIYADFLNHLSGGAASVNFSPVTNSYSVSVKNKGETAAQWGTEDLSVDHIVGRLLNSQAVVVTRTDSEGKTYVDREATTLAGLKAREITAEFGDWVFKDGDRRNQLVELFNEKFNTRVGRQYNGQHMSLPGKVPDSIIKMRRHQTNGVWRGVYEPFVLYDHAVGAGKTFTAIARAMERRRMGLSRKPMIVVPNHLVGQWETDVYRLYPGAKVLAAGKKDFEARRRRRLFGKIATGDWDIVIVPHSSFGFIGISPETESRYLEQELREAHAAIEAAWEQAEEDGVSSGRRKPFGVKEAERLAEKLQARADAVAAGVRDRLLTFEQLGVDDLTVDEAHEFKNLNYSSRLTGVRGMGDKSGSRKANDLYNKIRVLRDNPNGSVAFLTGTPISNSAVEMFTMLRYLAADQLEEMGMTHFDAFRAQFVEATPAFEPTESGRLKEVTRLGRTWSNMRSLMDLYYTVTDAVSLDDIKRMYAEDNKGEPFPVPKIKGGKDRELIAIKPTPAQEQALTDVMAGFDGLDGIEDPYERNAERLRLMDRARKVSLDIRAVNPRSDSTEPNGKLEQVSNNVKRIYDQWSDDKGTQLIFLDRSVPKAKGDDKVLKEYDDLVAKRDEAMARGDQDAFEDAVEALDKYDSNEINELRIAQSSPWNAYQQIKDNLVAMGIPANEIRFVQEANNDEQKAALFDAVKSGMVRVLLGSTPRMGAGTNVQDLAVALHHVDVTWKPSDIEQREGRVIRQENKLLEKYGPDFEVEILAYATERTVDAKMWDLNATKLRTINGIRKYDGAFSMEFEDEEAVGMAEMAALASGNPLLLERVQLESEIGNLELQERAHRRKMYGVQDELNAARRHIERNPGLIESARSRSDAAKQRVDAVEQAQASRTVTVEGQQYSELSEALAAASSAVSLQQAGNESARYAITINGERVTSKDGISTAISGALGDSAAFEATVDGERVIQRTAAARRAADMLNTGEGTRTVEVGELFGYQLMADVDVSEVGETTYTNLSLALMDGGETIASADANEQQGQAKFVTANLRSPIDRLVETVKGIASRESAGLLERQLEWAKRNLPSLEERAGETFPKAEELANKRARLTEVVVELDAAAPQAPSAEVETGDAPAFSFAGRRAMTSDPVALRAAQLRLASGENAETVRQETGWHRGSDGKWRFEISDNQASLAVPGATFGDIYANAYANAFAEGRKSVTVGDVLHHDQLFAAYPDLSRIPVSEMPEGERALARLQRRATGMAIQVQPGMPAGRVVSSLLHELQHGIQTIEGFARGGSARRFVSDMDRTGAATYRRLAGEVEARNTQARQRMTDRHRQHIPPSVTADVSESDVIVTFNGKDMINGPLPGNADTRPAMTQAQVVRAFQDQFPKLVPAVRTMLSRGSEGKRGGLVLVSSADPLMIAREFSKKTGRALSDTVQMFSEAGKINGFYDPKSGLTFLVTPNLNAVTAPAVLLHEMIHGQQRQRIDSKAMDMLMNRGSVRNPETKAFLDRVADRMIDAGESTNEAEAAAYIVEQAVIEGRSQGYAIADSKFLGWVDKTLGQRIGSLIRSFLANVRSWMLRNGMPVGEITVDDLVGYAMAGVERAARGRVDGGDVALSRDAITNDSKVAEQASPFAGFTREQFLGNPTITKDTNAATLRPRVLTTVATAEPEAFPVGRGLTAKYSPDGAAVFDGEQVIASYNFGNTLVVDKKHRRQGIAEELVYQWRMRNPQAKPARERTKKSQALQEKVWARIEREIQSSALNQSPIPQTETEAFKRWFGDSKVVDAEGNPLVVYHGATKGAEFGTFRVPAFFTSSADFAGHYADEEGGAIIPVYLNFKNPLLVDAMEHELGADVEELANSPAWVREQLSLGYDGFVVADGDVTTYVAFRPEQIKSAIGNNGNFDPNNPDIRFSRSGVTDRAKAVGDAIKSVTVTDVKRSAKGKLTDWLGMGLQALGRRQLIDLYDERLLPMAEYGKLVERMDAEKNDTGAKADELARRWGKLKDSAALADLMHDATLGRIDADSDVEIQEGDDSGDAKALKDRFDNLSAEAKAIYREARDSYKEHHREVIQAIKQRIERSEMQGKRKAELLKQMDSEFYKRVKGVYFPLARFGNYVVAVTDTDGKTVSVHRAETMGEANKLRTHLAGKFPASQGYAVGKVTLGKEYVASRDSVGRGFMTELYGALGELDIPGKQLAELEDTLGQLYLSSLPDLSWARHGIHRKGTPGYSDDARRAFAQNMFHGARYLAKLRYGDLMQDELDAMQKYADERKQDSDYDQPKAQRVVDEMVKRHDSMMNPDSNPIATALTSFGFVYYLGLSPAAAAVNLSQTALVAYPIMGAKWGFKKSADALMRASAQAVKGKNDITASLTDEERKAYDQAVKDGTIDVTMAHDLAGIAQGEDAKVMWKIRPVMRAASFMFHQAEVFNRQVTFIASYRLAREAGETEAKAYESAKKATYDGHFDYGAANRPRIMQGNVARVVLLFKQYAQNMMYTIARNAYQSVAGESPEVRKEARKVFGAIMGLHAAAAGVLGLPLVGPLLALASALGGDDDDPWDAEVAMRNMMADALGTKASEVIARGLSRLGPADISGRVNLNNLLLPDVQEGLEGRRLAEAWTSSLLGPVVGMGTNAAIGMQNIANGDYGRGLESMLPIAVRNPIKAYRYWDEGNVDRTGIVINDEVSWAGLGSQVVGFSPSEVRLAFEGRSAVFSADRRLGSRRSELMASFARASMDGDQKGMAKAREEIARFNEKNPTRRIQANHLMQSVRNRTRRIQQAEDGIYLPRNRRDVQDQGRFAAD